MGGRKIASIVLGGSLIFSTSLQSGNNGLYIQTVWAQGADTSVLTEQESMGVQEQQEDSEYKAEVILSYDSEGALLATAFLCENGDLWLDGKLVKHNVKEYITEGICYGGHFDVENVYYALDRNDALWSGDEMIAEDVQRYDAHYVLDSNGTLTNTYNDGDEQIEQVENWVWRNYVGDHSTYIKKTDGTLWHRLDVGRTQSLNPFEMIAENVQDMNENGYLKDGQYYLYGSAAPAGEAKTLMKGSNYAGYYSTEDHTVLIPSGSQSLQDCGCVGEVESLISGQNCYYLLNTEGELYQFTWSEGSVLIASDVERINPESYYGDWMYESRDGTYYNWSGEVTDTVTLQMVSFGGDVRYYLQLNERKEQVVVRTGKSEDSTEIIMERVDTIWRRPDTGSVYALCKDGIVWDITDSPEMLLDLKASGYLKGDVNEDGEVNIKDLQIVLRGVCEKIELTDRQKMIADVVEDGEVDIQDLRKELRFVCGKIEAL